MAFHALSWGKPPRYLPSHSLQALAITFAVFLRLVSGDPNTDVRRRRAPSPPRPMIAVIKSEAAD